MKHDTQPFGVFGNGWIKDGPYVQSGPLELSCYAFDGFVARNEDGLDRGHGAGLDGGTGTGPIRFRVDCCSTYPLVG